MVALDTSMVVHLRAEEKEVSAPRNLTGIGKPELGYLQFDQQSQAPARILYWDVGTRVLMKVFQNPRRPFASLPGQPFAAALQSPCAQQANAELAATQRTEDVSVYACWCGVAVCRTVSRG